MKSKARIERVGAALRRQRTAGGRLLMGYSEDGRDGPLWLDGRIVPADSVTESDTIVRITYKAADTSPNVKRLVWDYDDNPIRDDVAG